MSLAIENYTGDKIILWHSQKYKQPYETVKENFSRLKEFLVECSSQAEEQIPTKEVDELWHSFILHTYDYMEFCKNHFGKYIHHFPKIILSNSDCSDTGSPNAKANCGDYGDQQDVVENFATCGDKGVNPGDCSNGAGGCINPNP